MALLLAVLVLGVGGISVDLWRVVAEHGRLTAAVDAAAVAAAGAVDIDALYEPEFESLLLDTELATSRACDYLTDTLGALACPGADADVLVDGASITVTARLHVSTTLLRALLVASGDSGEIEVSTSATAAAFRLGPGDRPL